MAGEEELKALLMKPQAGLRLVHLHLGRLENPAIVDRKAVRYTLRELGKTAAAWRLFDIANGDLLMLYQGAADAAVEAACTQIVGLLPGARLAGVSPYGAAGAGPLYDIIPLTGNTSPVLRYLETAGGA